jgi:ATP-dependent Clp protease ATP-binding subunit ClpA
LTLMLGLSAEDVIDEIEQYCPEPSEVLDRLSAALQASERLTLVGDQVLDHFVQQARAAGASWAEIGQRMGVTKQAAQKRYVAPRTDPPPATADEPAPRMRRVVDLATQEARALGHPYVGTEHLLLGALRANDPLTASVLASVDIDEARALIAGTVPPTEVGADDVLPLTPRSRKVLESALAAARTRGEESADVADVVLGVVAERKGLGARLLDRFAGGLDDLHARVEQERQSG